MTGIACASFSVTAVREAANGNPLYFLLGGIFGLLPDTIDFKFCRFLFRHDIEVIPDPKEFNPQLIADAVAYAFNRAHETGRPVRIKLNTVRVGADFWRQYSVRFDVPNRRVTVTCGPIVDSSQAPVRNTTQPKQQKGVALLSCPVILDYEAATSVDAFDGPIFQMAPMAGKVFVHFNPWHREWSHSFVTGALLGVLGAVVLLNITAGLIIFAAYSMHILEDQLGFMGSNLFFPFNRKRSPGLRLTHSNVPMANFSIIWLCCVVAFWNLYAAAEHPVCNLTLPRVLFCGLILPLGAVTLIRRILPYGPGSATQLTK